MSRMMRRPPSPGFTLIELMIVVAVIVILGTVAVPSYNEYIRGVHRADARAGLLQAQQWLERAATANGVYPTTLPVDLTWARDSSKRYTIGFLATSGHDDDTYTLIATRRGSQLNDRCGDFTLTHTGERSGANVASSTTAAECWGR